MHHSAEDMIRDYGYRGRIYTDAGFYVWITVLMTAYVLKNKNSKVSLMTVPLWGSLIVCIMAPCFFLHPRYALPIIMGVPFILVHGLNAEKKD